MTAQAPEHGTPKRRTPHARDDETTAPSPWDELTCVICPSGTSPLHRSGVLLTCDKGHTFFIREGIPRLLPADDDVDLSKADPDQGSREDAFDLTVLLPALGEGKNLEVLLPQIDSVISSMHIRYEIIIVTESTDTTLDGLPQAKRKNLTIMLQKEHRYGAAIREGIARSRGTFILTMDADLSHRPEFIHDLWRQRELHDIVIASRYIKGGGATMPLSRKILSGILNQVFSRGLSLKVRDMSSGFRLMRRDAIGHLPIRARDFDVQQEILVFAYAQGWDIAEVPFHYAPRLSGSSHARVMAFGKSYLRTFWKLWKLRNSIQTADYDSRAFDSLIPLQRYWQRARCRKVRQLTRGYGRVLDVGCGSSRILASLPKGSVGMDILLNKLRYDRRYGVKLILGSGFSIPFPDASFPCVLSSEVIEHVPKDSPILDELCRVVSPGGRLIIGTPDYNSRLWVQLENIYGKIVPGGYADEHIAHYTHPELIKRIEEHGFTFEDERDIFGAEMILAFRKAGHPSETRR